MTEMGQKQAPQEMPARPLPPGADIEEGRHGHAAMHHRAPYEASKAIRRARHRPTLFWGG
jgi:hypothetical protein